MYDLLLIDLDETLLDFHEDARRALNKTWDALSFPRAQNLYERYEAYNGPLWACLESGAMTIEEIQAVRFRGILGELSLAADPAEVNHLYVQHLAREATLCEGVPEALRRLSERYALVLASNGIASVQKGRLRAAGIGKFFAHSILSEEVGASKPSPAFFLKGLQSFPDIPARRTLLIGDSLASDMRGAANMGYDACWVNRAKKERPEGLAIRYEVAAFREVNGFL